MTKANLLLYKEIKKSKLLKFCRPFLKKIGLKKVLLYLYGLLQNSTFPAKAKIEITISPSNQFRINVNPKFGEVDWYIYQHKIWEKNITDHFVKSIKPDDVIIDIGANIGYFTLLSAELTGKGGEVHAFEPQSEIYSALTENIRLNNFDQVIANHCGLGVATGTLILTQMPGNRGGGRILENPIQQGTQESIQIISLDDYVFTRQLTRINFIKMDVEGFELDVLKGANRVFTELKPNCLFEFSPDIWQKNKLNWVRKSQELLSYFLEKGYKLYDIDFKENITNENLNPYIQKFNKRRQSNIMATSQP